MTETEMKYAQIEHEALAIVFGCEHFHTYLFGRAFELETDHHSLEHLFHPKVHPTGKPPPAQIECWIFTPAGIPFYSCLPAWLKEFGRSIIKITTSKQNSQQHGVLC